MLRLLLVHIISICVLITNVKSGVPIGTGGPSIILESKDALLTCVVSDNSSNNTVIWKKGDEILTAGTVRVTKDHRVRILHDENPKGKNLETGGEVWVLLIKSLKPSDSGAYICELNSDPVLRSIHILTVKELHSSTGGPGNSTDTATAESGDVFLLPPPLDAQDNRSFWRPSQVPPLVTHDFTECCERANVSTQCMGFCNVHNILDGTTGIDPEACERDFPGIVRCMADGRNHVPCCVDKQIPDLCQDMCRGEYTPFTDKLKTRVSCVQHTLSGLQCILKGVQLIPSSPTFVTIENVSETSVSVGWTAPDKLAERVSGYTVNLTTLHSFDEDELSGEIVHRTAAESPESISLYTVPANQTQMILNRLNPLTMYAVMITATNEFGSSLPSERLRFFTHTSASAAESRAGTTDKQAMPQLPDTRQCCEDNGMTHRMCLDKMCDPQKTDQATLPDFMVCAPWSNITFTCLANNIDHTPCCRARGIPAACFPLCAGKLTSLDFSLFKCLRFMSEYNSCLFQGYGVLADPPSKLRTVAKTDSFVILDWNKPKRLADTVSTYHVKFRRLGVGDDYLTVQKRQPPLILEGLESDIYYEFYVVSINAYGKSEASPRLITRTLAAEPVQPTATRYNMTTCCQASGLLPQCAPLCSYNIRLSDIERLGPACRAQMPLLARCAAGGRDHSPCCSRRGVINACMPLCRGVMPLALTTKSAAAAATSSAAAATSAAATSNSNAAATSSSSSSSSSSSGTSSNVPDCLSYAGNILQCFEEGTQNIPGPPEDVHATFVNQSSVSLAWAQPDVDNANNRSSGNSNANASPGDMITGDELAAGAVGSANGSPAAAGKDVLSAGDATSGTTGTEDIEFIVQYGKVNNMTMYETVAKLENELTTNETSIDLTNLDANALYRITVVTRGKFGTSLPASMLLLNTTDQQRVSEVRGEGVAWGAPSPPHSLTVVAHSATWMQLTWQPPEYAHPHERITYRVYHKAMRAEQFIKIETKLAWLRMNNLKPSSQHVLYVEAVGERGESLPSETLVAWTDPALPAFVDPPTVHPADNIPEGGSMTILCLALGNPAPTISLYVGGHLVRQDTSRHMVTVIHNVSADMEHVSCYADNGYGVPMQATRRVNICYPPKIQAAGITVANIGDEIELRCTVDSKPAPKTIFWREKDGRVPVINGGNYFISVKANESRPSIYTMSLRISKLQANDVGDYFCHADNPFGATTTPVSVRIRNTPALNHNVSQCCAEQNVTMGCRSACSYYVDFDAIADRPECIVDFDKLMRCAADGSDHRSCCADEHVPRKCLNWCRGESVRSKEICSLQYARTIVGCFEKNRDRLPGPPENIVVSVVSDSEVSIRWDAPTKNPNAVDGYRIFYHEAAVLPPTSSSSPGPGSSSSDPSSSMENPGMDTLAAMNNATSMGGSNIAMAALEIRRIDVKDTTISINGLKKDVLYELVVKAGNSYGASVLTDPIRFTLGEHHVTSATSSYSSAVGTISGIVASILAILLAAAAIVFYRRQRSSYGKSANGNVAFENPTYTRGLEQVQLPTVTSAITTQNGSHHGMSSSNNNGGNSHSHGRNGIAATMTTSTTTTAPTTAASATSAGVTLTGNRQHHQQQQHQQQQQQQQQQQHQQQPHQQHKSAADAAHHFHNPLSNTQCNEVNPTIYEELKLGQEGAGFKKLVP